MNKTTLIFIFLLLPISVFAFELNITINVQDENTCNISLGLETEKILYNSGEKISFKNNLNTRDYDFEIEYWIEDLFGDIVKKKAITTNTNSKSYTPKITIPDKVIIIKNKLVSIDCNNINNNTENEILLVVKGEAGAKEETESKSYSEKETETTEEKKETKKEAYEILAFPEKVFSGEEFEIIVRINNSAQAQLFTLYSYVYKSSVSYSGERERNIDAIMLFPFETSEIEQKITVNASPGMYKIKVKIARQGIKTEKEITKDIEIIEKKVIWENNETKETETEKTSQDNSPPELITGKTVQEQEQKILLSASAKAKRLIPYVIILSLAAACFVIIWRKE